MAISAAPAPMEAVQALAPLIRAYADQIERDRRLPDVVVRALLDSGVFRLLVPRAFGGAEADPITVCRALESLARMDGATGWCAMLGTCYGLFGGLLPQDAAREIYMDPDAILAGALSPIGGAQVVEGGYRLSGRWPLGSGIMHANWTVGGALVLDGEQPQLTADGAPMLRLLFFPRSEADIIDTWHAPGLRGTGSHDYAATDLFVPAQRAFWFNEPPVQAGPLYSLPAIALFAAFIACVPLGIARHALDGFKAVAGVKKVSWSQQPWAERPVIQDQLGQAEGLLRAGRAFLYEVVEEAWDIARRGEPLSWEQRGLLWLAATQAAVQAARAVDLVFAAGSSSSVYPTAPMERCLRDIRTAGQHICVTNGNFELAGRLFLGLDMLATPWGMDNRGDA